MNKPWFDPKTGMPCLDDYVAEMPSFKRIMADNVVTGDEILEQAHRTTSLLRKLESMLSPEAKSVATEALCELSVLQALYRKGQMAPR